MLTVEANSAIVTETVSKIALSVHVYCNYSVFGITTNELIFDSYLPRIIVYSCNNACCLYTLQDVLTGFHNIVVQCV